MMLEYHRQLSGNAFAKALERYFERTLHGNVRIREIDEAVSVPVFLERTYAFFKARIFGKPFVLIAARENAATPDIAKQSRLTDGSRFHFRRSVFERAQQVLLIARGVAFAVPGNQLYIPELAMDLREKLAPKAKRREVVTCVRRFIP